MSAGWPLACCSSADTGAGAPDAPVRLSLAQGGEAPSHNPALPLPWAGDESRLSESGGLAGLCLQRAGHAGVECESKVGACRPASGAWVPAWLPVWRPYDACPL